MLKLLNIPFLRIKKKIGPLMNLESTKRWTLAPQSLAESNKMKIKFLWNIFLNLVIFLSALSLTNITLFIIYLFLLGK